MTRLEFQKLINDLFGLEDFYPNGIYTSNPTKRERTELSIEWRTGGATGGNCWGDEAIIPVDAEIEPEFDDLFAILETVVPNLTFLDYKKLTKLIENDGRTEYEYYGNCSHYSIKRISIDNLYNFLKEHNYL